MTHRQFLAWQAWLDEQEREPSLSDYYAMQVALEVRRVLSKNPNAIKLEDFKIKFEIPGEKRVSAEDERQLIETEKSIWKYRLEKAQAESRQRVRKLR